MCNVHPTFSKHMSEPRTTLSISPAFIPICTIVYNTGMRGGGRGRGEEDFSVHPKPHGQCPVLPRVAIGTSCLCRAPIGRLCLLPGSAIGGDHPSLPLRLPPWLTFGKRTGDAAAKQASRQATHSSWENQGNSTSRAGGPLASHHQPTYLVLLGGGGGGEGDRFLP